ncbi:MAG: leucine-rich repeat protein [Treponema sp.]
MKSKIYIFLSLLFIFSGCMFDTDKEYVYGNYKFKNIDKQSVSFCGLNSEAKLSGTLYIPETIYGLNVVKIEGQEYGSKYKDIVSIVIPSTVKTIGDNAFHWCSSIETISIPDGVTTIGNRAFWGCSSLKEITLPASVKSIGESAFEDCKALASFNAGETAITEIKVRTFSGCTALNKEFSLPSTVAVIGNKAFSYSGIPGYYVESDEQLVSIGLGAFEYCSKLEAIIFPLALKSIAYNAFEGCSALNSVTFADTNFWYVQQSSSSTWTAVNVTNPATNAQYLKNTYKDYRWGKGH